MKEIISLVLFFLVLILIPYSSSSSENKGAATFYLDGGSRGVIQFPHIQHQLSGIDCNTCHSIFLKKIGAIKMLIDNGSLEKKYVMNKLCISCHKNNKKKGNKTGPVTCKLCHVK